MGGGGDFFSFIGSCFGGGFLPAFPSFTVPCQVRILNCRAACSLGTEIKQKKFPHCCKTDSVEVEGSLH